MGQQFEVGQRIAGCEKASPLPLFIPVNSETERIRNCPMETPLTGRRKQLNKACSSK